MPAGSPEGGQFGGGSGTGGTEKPRERESRHRREDRERDRQWRKEGAVMDKKHKDEERAVEKQRRVEDRADKKLPMTPEQRDKHEEEKDDRRFKEDVDRQDRHAEESKAFDEKWGAIDDAVEKRRREDEKTSAKQRRPGLLSEGMEQEGCKKKETLSRWADLLGFNPDQPRGPDGRWGSGGGGESEKDHEGDGSGSVKAEKIRDKVMSRVDKSLDGNKSLSDSQRALYGDSVRAVMENMNAKACGLVEQNVKNWNFYSSHEELGQSLVDRGLLSKENLARGTVGGAFLEGELHLAGSLPMGAHPDLGGQTNNIHHVYAHEMAHAVDGPGFKTSKNLEWSTPWAGEIASLTQEMKDRPPLSRYAQSSVVEGFAEFGRFAYAGNRAKVEKKFPKCTARWKELGIW